MVSVVSSNAELWKVLSKWSVCAQALAFSPGHKTLPGKKTWTKTKEAWKTHVKRRAKTCQFSSPICKLHLGSIPVVRKHAQQSRGGLALPISMIPPIMTDLHHETWTSQLMANQTFHMHFWNASPTQLPSYWILITRVKSPWNSLKSLHLTTTHKNLEAPSPSTPINPMVAHSFPKTLAPIVALKVIRVASRSWCWASVKNLEVGRCFFIRCSENAILSGNSLKHAFNIWILCIYSIYEKPT